MCAVGIEAKQYKVWSMSMGPSAAAGLRLGPSWELESRGLAARMSLRRIDELNEIVVVRC